MPSLKLALLALASALIGCSSSMDGPDSPTGDDDGDVPFTNGVSTLAGMADAGFVDGARRFAQFNNPVNVLYRDGMVYVADFDNGRIRMIDVETHNTGTLIEQAGFKRPFGMAFAPDGQFYVSTDNDLNGRHTPMSGSIWRVDMAKKSAIVVANAIGRPRGIAFLPDGRMVATDYLHHVIEIINVNTGEVTPIAGAWDGAGMADGPGDVARFSAPYNVVVLDDGSMMVTDFDNNRIRRVTVDGTTTTMSGASQAGLVDGTMANARFSKPQAMVQAENGDIYVTDLGNFRVRRIRGDAVETIAGNGTGGYADNDDPMAAQFYGLEGMSVTPDGSMLYVADGTRGEPTPPYNRVRQIKLP